jgi:hypothetical protein
MKKKTTKTKRGDVMRKVRKPIPPPSRVEDDLKRYRRQRERARLRRELGETPSGEN